LDKSLEKKPEACEKMKAIVYKKYGSPDVLKIQEIEKPLPKENEVIVKIHAASVNYGDLMARNFKNISPKEFNMPFLVWIFARFSFGFKKPKTLILGNSFSGVIETVGCKVEKFKVGDAVFGYTGEKMGAYAEYLCLSENEILTTKPLNMTFEEASVIPYGAIMSICLLKKANIQKGQKVLVVGASGGIGSVAIQLVKNYFGAEVTGVCSTQRVEYVKKLGAEKVIDYKQDDFTKNGETYDLIFDILDKGSILSYKKSLKQKGIYLLASFKTNKLLQMLWTALIGKKKVVCAFANPKGVDLMLIKELIEAGKIKSIIDKRYTLEQTAEAHRYIEEKEKKGDVVISLY
jgi:NADPH:quinone reductase-like Zn-dependent oxidoreductase